MDTVEPAEQFDMSAIIQEFGIDEDIAELRASEEHALKGGGRTLGREECPLNVQVTMSYLLLFVLPHGHLHVLTIAMDMDLAKEVDSLVEMIAKIGTSFNPYDRLFKTCHLCTVCDCVVTEVTCPNWMIPRWISSQSIPSSMGYRQRRGISPTASFSPTRPRSLPRESGNKLCRKRPQEKTPTSWNMWGSRSHSLCMWSCRSGNPAPCFKPFYSPGPATGTWNGCQTPICSPVWPRCRRRGDIAHGDVQE